MVEEYKDYCFQDFTDADRIRVREDYWKEYDKIMESYRSINAEYDVARAIIEELALIYHTDTSTIMTILSKGKKRRFDGGMLRRNHPTEDNKQDVETMKSIISSDFNIRGKENAEKKAKRKIDSKDNRKPVEQDMVVGGEEKEGEKKKSKVDTEKLREKISKFISEILNGDEDKFEDIFIGYINGERTRDSIIDELGGRKWSGILPYFKHAIEIACDISPEEGEILKFRFENLPPLKEHINFLEFAKEYKKVESGEQMERDVLDHLYISKSTFDDNLRIYKGSNNNKPVGGEEKVGKRKNREKNEKVAPEVFKMYISGEKQWEIAVKYGQSQRWVSNVIEIYLNEHPEQKQEYEAQKEYNIKNKRGGHKKEKITESVEETVIIEEEEPVASTNEDIKEVSEPLDISVDEKEQVEITVKSADIPNVNLIFEPANTIEVNLYKSQPNGISDAYHIFPSRFKFINNMEEEDVRDCIKAFISDHVRFKDHVPQTDIILYIGAATDYKLVMPVVDVCSKMGVVVAVNEFNSQAKKYEFVYSTGKPNKDDANQILFTGCNKVEGLGCTLDDVINADHLYEMIEVMYDSNGKETYVYKLLAVDNADYLRRVYASEVSNMILNNKGHISVSIGECSIENGKLVDGEQNESYKKM